jgi:hypothetical protein
MTAPSEDLLAVARAVEAGASPVITRVRSRALLLRGVTDAQARARAGHETCFSLCAASRQMRLGVARSIDEAARLEAIGQALLARLRDPGRRRALLAGTEAA